VDAVTAWLLSTRLGRLLAWALAGVAAILAAWVAGRREGASTARAEAAAKAAKDYADTRKRIDHDTRHAGTGTDDDIRERLRRRGEQ
jgi:hypothetical protein